MSDFLGKQRKAAGAVKLTKQKTTWTGAFPKPGTNTTPAKQIRNTNFIWPLGGNRGIKAPE